MTYAQNLGGGGGTLGSWPSQQGPVLNDHYQGFNDWTLQATKDRLAKGPYAANPSRPFSWYLDQAGGGRERPDPMDVPIVQAFTPDQIAKRTNQFFSEGATQAATQSRENSAAAAGRGFGSQSPYVQELNAAAQGRSYRTATEGATNFELGAAETNAELAMRSWLARVQAYGYANAWDQLMTQSALGIRGQDIQREANLFGFNNQGLSQAKTPPYGNATIETGSPMT